MGQNNSKDICDEAYNHAVKILENCSHSVGIKASAKINGYPQVWARDSMISLLGAVLTKNSKIIKSLKSSFNILRKEQTSLGLIPNNVNVKTLKPDFQAYADCGLWFVIGNSFFFNQIRDKKFLKRNYLAIKKTMSWYEHQETDQTGLIAIEEASDWEDLFAVRGKGLYVNVLYYLALVNVGRIAKNIGDKKQAKIYLNKSKKLKIEINKFLWYVENKDLSEYFSFCFGTEFLDEEKIDVTKLCLPKKSILKKDSYYLPYLTFRNFGEWFDAFGNLLAILSGVADKKQVNSILDFIKKYKLGQAHPIKAIYPPIKLGEKDWRDYYKYHNLNLPNHYHNGGLWPFLGGFYVVALVKAKKYSEAQEALESLALLNKKGKHSKWEFNEWFNGKTGKPMGREEQAWSAGMYLSAYDAVKNKKVRFF